jgi:amino acid transporter
VLNAAVGVSAGVEALTAAFPSLYGARVWLCLAVLGLITAVNLWGVAESARVFMVPTVAFIVAIFVVIVVGLARAHPAVALSHAMAAPTESVGILLVLKSFASGCSALTGVEAIANSVPQFRLPRARRAQHTEVALGVLLGLMLLGLGALIHRWGALPQPGTTVLAQLTAGAIGHGVVFYAIQLITLVLLSLAANTSFGGLPVLAGLLARDNFLPHVFGLRADRRVFRYGVGFLAVTAALLLVVAQGNTQALIPVFAVGVFIGFTLSQVGMVRHWYAGRDPGFRRRALINGVGAVLTFAATAIELVSKFLAGAWLVVLVIPLLALRSPHRSLAKPIVSYLRSVEADDKYHRLVVLIPEVEPSKPWEWLLHNQRGIILERAIRRGTSNVVLCRLRYRLATLAATGAPAGTGTPPGAEAPAGDT